jgi:hypothetical protein
MKRMHHRPSARGGLYLAAAIAATGLTTIPASAEATLFIGQLGNLGTGRIEVTSSDGKDWTYIKPGKFGATVRIRLESSVGRISSFDIRQQTGQPIYWSGEWFWKDAPKKLETVVKVTGSTQNFAIDALLLRQACTAKGKPDKSYSFGYPVSLTLTGYFTTKNGDLPSARTAGTVTIPVLCKSSVKTPVGDIAVDQGPFKVKEVDQFLATFSHNKKPGTNPGSKCPMLKVTSRARTSKSGPVTMRIWRQKADGAITSRQEQAWSSFDAKKNGYFAHVTSWENVGTTSFIQFKTEIENGGPFAPSTSWKGITVHCSSPGGGGLAPDLPDNSDTPKPKARWQGSLTISDSAGSRKACPRKGQVAFNASNADPGNFKYRIGCSNGASFKATATGFAGGGGFAASGAHPLSFNRTRKIVCTLQEMLPGNIPVTVATASIDVTCRNPAIKPDADDLTVGTRPSAGPAKPLRPQKLRETLLCKRGETLHRGRCLPVRIVRCAPDQREIRGRCAERVAPARLIAPRRFQPERALRRLNKARQPR